MLEPEGARALKARTNLLEEELLVPMRAMWSSLVTKVATSTPILSTSNEVTFKRGLVKFKKKNVLQKIHLRPYVTDLHERAIFALEFKQECSPKEDIYIKAMIRISF